MHENLVGTSVRIEQFEKYVWATYCLPPPSGTIINIEDSHTRGSLQHIALGFHSVDNNWMYLTPLLHIVSCKNYWTEYLHELCEWEIGDGNQIIIPISNQRIFTIKHIIHDTFFEVLKELTVL
jgi:hypothetical protein